MTTSATESDHSWIDLTQLGDAEIVPAMRDRMSELAAMPSAEERDQVIRKLVLAETGLDDAPLHRMTLSRFRAWLSMPASSVQAISTGIIHARDELSGPAAMRSTSAAQTAARELSAEECVKLLELAPSFQHALPREMQDLLASTAHREAEATTTADPTAPTAEKAWWRFWTR